MPLRPIAYRVFPLHIGCKVNYFRPLSNEYFKVEPNSVEDFLEEKVVQFETPDFIPQDPISIPHMFSNKMDVEISGFLVATIAWGKDR